DASAGGSDRQGEGIAVDRPRPDVVSMARPRHAYARSDRAETHGSGQMRRDLQIKTADGTAKAALFRPDTAPSGKALRGFILYRDAMGPRASLAGMAQRLADAGHVVLLPDLFYRFGAYGPFTGASFGDEAARAQIMTMLRETSQEMTK